MLVDDDEDFGKLMIKLLKNENVELLVARTLTEGMMILEKELPEYVFLDNMLPDGAGWSKTEFILHNYPKIHLNLLSALNVPKTSASTFRIIEKPLSLQELLSCLNY